MHRRTALGKGIALLAVALARCTSRPSPSSAMARAPQALGQGALIRYVVLGDSTAAGVGADYAQGIVMETARSLASHRRVEVMNLSVSGATFRDVLREQIPQVRGLKPDLVLVDVGANDVTHLTSSASIKRDLDAILRSLIATRCEVRIVLTGAPDMGSPPRIPFLLRGLASRRTRRINAIALGAVSKYGLTFAPIAEQTGPLFRRDRTLFSADRFHPNARGYALWVPVLVDALESALVDQPAHCSSIPGSESMNGSNASESSEALYQPVARTTNQ